MPTVLIGAEPIRRQPGRFRALLEAAGFTVVDPDVDGKLTASHLRQWLPACDAVIAGGEAYSAEVIAACPSLRAIARTGVGYDDVDVPAATARGVVVTITPGANHEAVAEQTFALLLALVKDLATHERTIRSGAWARHPLPRPLRGSTLGLVGLGRIGRAVAVRAVAFGMRVIAFDPVEDPEFDARVGVTRRPFTDLLATADMVSLHLPLTESTRGMLDHRVFGLMRPGTVLINTSRGGLVVEDDLVAALRSGHLAGAGLDVFAAEPTRADHPLWSVPNLALSPHLAGVDTLAMSDMAAMAAQNLIDLQAGRWPETSVVNPAVASGWRWSR